MVAIHKPAHDIILKPVVSEKSYALSDRGQYTFVVAPEANKIQIREAVEKLFNVRVKAVNTLIVKGQTRSRAVKKGRSRVSGREATVKKAIVTLFPGQRIDIFEQV